MSPKSRKRVPIPLQQAREWVSFEDPDERRRWLFDVTFLLSNWSCIFGAGCPGVLTGRAPELVQGCCSYGAHFSNRKDRDHVVRISRELTDEDGKNRLRHEILERISIYFRDTKLVHVMFTEFVIQL